MNKLGPRKFHQTQYSVGENSQRFLIHQQDDLFIAHEHLFQNATPSRFYHHSADTFVFVIKGELYLSQIPEEYSHRNDEDNQTILKAHQGIWLAAQSMNKVTLLSPAVELCIVRLNPNHAIDSSDDFKKVSSGNVASLVGRNRIQVWPLWQGKTGQISLELYPPHYKETLYYEKSSTQYILPLKGHALITKDKKTAEVCPTSGKVIPQKEPRAMINPTNESIVLFSIITSKPNNGRVLLLKRASHQ